MLKTLLVPQTVARPSTWLGTVSPSLDSARDPELAEGSNREVRDPDGFSCLSGLFGLFG